MINSYFNSFKISKKPIKQQGLCTKAKLGKKSKIISSVLIKNEYFLEFKRQCYKHLKPTRTWLQGCQNVLSSRQIIMKVGALELAPRHKFLRAVALSDILKFRVSEMAFSGVFKRYSPPPRMPCCFVRIRARLGTMPSKRLSKCPRLIVWTFHRSKPA